MEQNPYSSKSKNSSPLVRGNPIVTSCRSPISTENHYSFGKTHTPNILIHQSPNNNSHKVQVHSDFIIDQLSVDTSSTMFQGISFGYKQILNNYQHDGPELFEVNIEADDQEVGVQLKALANNKTMVNIVYFHKYLRTKWFVKHTQIKKQNFSVNKRYKPSFSCDESNNIDNNTHRKIHSEFITRHFASNKSNTFNPPIPFGYKHILNDHSHEGPQPFDVNVVDDNEELAIQFFPLPNNNMKVNIFHVYKGLFPKFNIKYTKNIEEETYLTNTNSDNQTTPLSLLEK